MSNEKQQQILQMAKDICRVKLNCNDVCNPISACDALKYAERAVEAGYCKPEWISVVERLPKERERVLVVCEDGIVRLNMVKHGYFPEITNIDCISVKTTHWMPLPEAPKGGTE